MKVLYLGKEDNLCEGILQRISKEGNSVYNLSAVGSNDGRKIKKCKYYTYQTESDIEEVFDSVFPDVVIFAGEDYMNPAWETSQSRNITLMLKCLDVCVSRNVKHFIMLSSVEVYGFGELPLDEDSALMSHSIRGIVFSQNENMLNIYKERYGLNACILRVDYVLGAIVSNEQKAFFALNENDGISIQPIFVSDVADAVIRVVENGAEGVYNVAGSRSITIGDLNRLLEGEKEKNSDENYCAVNTRKIREELEWVDFRNIREMINEYKIKIIRREEEKQKEKKKQGSLIRNLIENFVLAAFFIVLYYICKEHILFSRVDWLLVYVVVISLYRGIRQGTVAIFTASVAYLVLNGKSILEMSNFYLYVENLITIVQYIFFGIITGYTVDTLKANVDESKRELDSITASYVKLKEINAQTLQIKNEYEKRILNTKESLPNIYSIIKRINILDSDKIMWEILNVIKEMINTDTVSVYRYNERSEYVRLMYSLNERSVYRGRSWNVADNTNIYNAITNTAMYEGDIWNNEPAIVLPVSISDGVKIIIIINELPMKNLSLYTTNILNTLVLLIEGAIERAVQYDNITRQSRYIDGTDILTYEEFVKTIDAEEEKKGEGISDYSLIKVESEQMLMDTYNRVENSFREIDIFGTDVIGNLYVLLCKTSCDDLRFIADRLEKQGILVKSVGRNEI